jgi:2-polyprenyl-3-methyl-5-hydroxy-6-metoxy-1,4-benzoquinol methylase
MKAEAIDHFRCPVCSSHLELKGANAYDGQPICTGELACRSCGNIVPIVDAIPRFVQQHYTENFGFQWTQFATTQIDRYWDAPISETRFWRETRWPANLQGEKILEVGCGSGRFTQFAAATGAALFSIDASAAVDVAARNNSEASNITFAQASLYNPPFLRESFDKIFCFGVIQHCPSPKKAFFSLVSLLKPGGEIVIDVYRMTWRVPFLGKYYLRPLTKRMDAERLLKFVRRWVGIIFPFTGAARRLIGGHSRKLSWALAVADYRGVYDLSPEKQFELSVLDTYDMLSPAYDRPQTLSAVRRWLEEAGLEDIEVKPGYNGIEARGRRPAST